MHECLQSYKTNRRVVGHLGTAKNKNPLPLWISVIFIHTFTPNLWVLSLWRGVFGSRKVYHYYLGGRYWVWLLIGNYPYSIGSKRAGYPLFKILESWGNLLHSQIQYEQPISQKVCWIYTHENCNPSGMLSEHGRRDPGLSALGTILVYVI